MIMPNLLAPETMNLGSYVIYNYDNPNLRFRIMLVLCSKVEYRPGSTIFVVYNINKNKYFSASDNEWSKNQITLL